MTPAQVQLVLALLALWFLAPLVPDLNRSPRRKRR